MLRRSYHAKRAISDFIAFVFKTALQQSPKIILPHTAPFFKRILEKLCLLA